MRRCSAQAAGFSYLGLLLVLALLALAAAAALKVGAALQRREAELALLEIGAQFSQALGSYARATPQGQPDAPKVLEELLLDARQAGTVRHLRKRFVDPLSGQAEWGLERAEQDGRIVAVYSLASGQPIKLAGFDRRFPGFEGKRSYQDWKFTRAAGMGAPRGGLVRPGDGQGDDPSPDDETGTRATVTPTTRP